MTGYESVDIGLESHGNHNTKSMNGTQYTLKEILGSSDVRLLHEYIVEKERERQNMASDLDMAARLGLAISEANEELQAKLSQLEQERDHLKAELTVATKHPVYSPDDSSSSFSRYMNDLRISGSENGSPTSASAMSPIEERNKLRAELDEATRELTRFHKEMESVSVQLNDMAAEMAESQSKVGVYSKRLAEVEHSLTTTQEMNVNLQILLEKALNSQKQSNASTNHVVRNIQSDVSKVLNENNRLRNRINELEEYQTHCEKKLVKLVDQSKEYAHLLQQAQDAIYQMNQYNYTSDMDTPMTGTFTPKSPSLGWDGTMLKESEITKGPVFSAEFKQEMQKEIERELSMRNDMRHRIVKHDSMTLDRSHAAEGLKYLLSEREVMSASNSTSTSSSVASRPKVKEQVEQPPAPQKIDSTSTKKHQGTSEPSFMSRGLRPLSSSSDTLLGLRGLAPSGGYVLRSMPRGSAGWTATAATARGSPSISTKFFRRLASNLDAYDTNNHEDIDDDIDGL
ncbi:hypothetical protein BC943DRAFT_179519 [Umbelopsis sp. AD052]|nr:hypothetical protein BC943DRAFT_179519 [Umbelopsis sp. AD052]